MKCYKAVLKIKSLKKNYGFFIIASIILFYFITLFIFITISFSKLKDEINKIIFALRFKETPIKNDKGIEKQLIIIKKKRKHSKKKTKKIDKEKKIIVKNSLKENILKINKKLNMNNFKEKDVIHFEKNNQNNEDDSGYNININQNMNIEKNNDLNIMKEILDKKDFELSSLGYKEALKLDHRSYCQYYISSLKYNHPILFSFGTYDDYNSKIIKIFLFFFSFCLDLTINALFFTDETMHKIYQDKGQFNFLYQIPQISYVLFKSSMSFL